MKNEERADRLLSEAESIFNEIEQALESENWNLAIRRAQEVVELVLKGLLAQLGIDYPKVHDVAPIFKRSVEERGVMVDEEFMNWLIEFSADLSTKRAPSFYFEAEYDEDDAVNGAKGAEEVIKFGKRFIEAVRKK
ncbi:MAG: hypothetical protein C5S38_04335 [Candidatus Methanophagaceae archaeon]|nr:MAG: hypothetical protein C5S38_04335 [Methanophagales archaeon]KAF5436311.1 hypothetical protein C5S36_00570 [Methanophagales archaeon]